MKEYYSRHASRFVAAGGVLLVLSLFALMGDQQVPLFTMIASVPMLFMGLTLKTTPLVRLGAETIEVKAGPFAAKKVVPLGAIQRVDGSNARVIFLHTPDGRIGIPAFALEDYQRREILRALGE